MALQLRCNAFFWCPGGCVAEDRRGCCMVNGALERALPWPVEKRREERMAFRGGGSGRCDHDVSILIACGTGEGRCLGFCPRKKVSMMIMRLPQQGQGCSGAFGSSGLALAALMASIGMRGTASSSRIRAILRARVWLVRKP